MIGFAIYTEVDDPEIVRTHSFDKIISMDEREIILATNKGRRKHKYKDYVDFGVFPFGPANQQAG